MDKVRWRRDGMLGDDERLKMAWAWRLPAFDGGMIEVMAMLYGINKVEGEPDPIVYALGMTHEITTYALDPEKNVDFGRNLFEQPELSPLLPACVGFQFRAKSTSEAIQRIQEMSERVIAGTLPAMVQSEWKPFFEDGCDIVTPLPDIDQNLDRLEVADSRSGVLTRGTKPRKSWADLLWALAPSHQACRVTSVSAASVGVIVALAWVAVAFDMQTVTDKAHEVARDVFYRELVMPDGSVQSYTLTKVPGTTARYKVLMTTTVVAARKAEAETHARLAREDIELIDTIASRSPIEED